LGVHGGRNIASHDATAVNEWPPDVAAWIPLRIFWFILTYQDVSRLRVGLMGVAEPGVGVLSWAVEVSIPQKSADKGPRDRYRRGFNGSGYATESTGKIVRTIDSRA